MDGSLTRIQDGRSLILLRRLGGPVFAVNPDLIERAEATPDTVLTMLNGNEYLICETLDELTGLIRDHRARIIAQAESIAVKAAVPPNTTARSGVLRLQDVSNPSGGSSGSVTSIRPKDS
jgi:flagellar protein FlbD